MTLPVLLLVLFPAAAIISLCVAKLLTKTKVTTRRFDGFRTWSVSDIPRVGGVAVFATIPLAGVAWALGERGGIPEIFGPLIIGAGLLFCVGLLDDLRG